MYGECIHEEHKASRYGKGRKGPYQKMPRGPLEGLPRGSRVVRVGDGEHILLINTHHIATDEWSVNLLSDEIGAAYSALVAGESPRLPELTVQYSDYARW